MELTAEFKVRGQSYGDRTYQWSETKIEGFVDELAALKQSIEKALSTEKYEYPIYSFRYGIPWKELIGEEQAYVRAELRRMIEEMLLQDDRIRDVDGFHFEFSGDVCRCSFDVSSRYGELRIETEVAV